MTMWTRALVTGASSGIGRELATRLAETGTGVVLVARSGNALEELATALRDEHGVEAEALPADLTDPGALGKVESRLRDHTSPVDLLVNNAGFTSLGTFHELDVDREEEMVTLNVIALTRLAHAAASAMAERGRGGILNVSSVGGFQPVPYFATYGATKAYVTSFGQALHEELRDQGVHVTTLCPGMTETDLPSAADIEHEASRVPEIAWMSASEVASAGLAGLARNRAIVVPGTAYKVTAAVSTLLPNRLVRRLIGGTVKRF